MGTSAGRAARRGFLSLAGAAALVPLVGRGALGQAAGGVPVIPAPGGMVPRAADDARRLAAAAESEADGLVLLEAFEPETALWFAEAEVAGAADPAAESAGTFERAVRRRAARLATFERPDHRPLAALGFRDLRYLRRLEVADAFLWFGRSVGRDDARSEGLVAFGDVWAGGRHLRLILKGDGSGRGVPVHPHELEEAWLMLLSWVEAIRGGSGLAPAWDMMRLASVLTIAVPAGAVRVAEGDVYPGLPVDPAAATFLAAYRAPPAATGRHFLVAAETPAGGIGTPRARFDEVVADMAAIAEHLPWIGLGDRVDAAVGGAWGAGVTRGPQRYGYMVAIKEPADPAAPNAGSRFWARGEAVIWTEPAALRVRFADFDVVPSRAQRAWDEIEAWLRQVETANAPLA